MRWYRITQKSHENCVTRTATKRKNVPRSVLPHAGAVCSAHPSLHQSLLKLQQGNPWRKPQRIRVDASSLQRRLRTLWEVRCRKISHVDIRPIHAWCADCAQHSCESLYRASGLTWTICEATECILKKRVTEDAELLGISKTKVFRVTRYYFFMR